MEWTNFPFFGILSSILWISGVIIIWLPGGGRIRKTFFHLLIITGIAVFGFFLVALWINLGRAPMRTLGETRLWYAFFLSFIGYIAYVRWRYKWFLSYSILMSLVFSLINLIYPENFSKTLVPALQSPWFVPHVIVYIFGYALLGAATIVALKGLYLDYFHTFRKSIMNLSDNLVYLGFAFLTLGLLFGAIWAKEAWGHYWTWDPKETWAFVTWLAYLLYIHYRHFHPAKVRTPLWMLGCAFIILLVAWFGVNYLPAASDSIHVYS